MTTEFMDDNIDNIDNIEDNVESEHIDFIGIYKNVIDPNFCDHLVDIMNNSHEVYSRNLPQIQDKQFGLDGVYPDQANHLMQLVNQCLGIYISNYSYLANYSYVTSVSLMQHTKPIGGYHMWHGENLTWTCQTRTMAWMVYLNDVEEGGETEFLYQGLRIKPTKGTVVIWPGSYTHLHRGNPPMSDKYIATGWYQGSLGLRKVQTEGLELNSSHMNSTQL